MSVDGAGLLRLGSGRLRLGLVRVPADGRERSWGELRAATTSVRTSA
ncbi:hypothetical protein AB0D67_20785 [Streptosporangium sp. NPDC048047]